MSSPLKKINKRIVGLVIGSAILGLSSVTGGKNKRGLVGRVFSWMIQKGRDILDSAERLGEKIAKRP